MPQMGSWVSAQPRHLQSLGNVWGGGWGRGFPALPLHIALLCICGWFWIIPANHLESDQ